MNKYVCLYEIIILFMNFIVTKKKMEKIYIVKTELNAIFINYEFLHVY